jgi:hypothetical protein
VHPRRPHPVGQAAHLELQDVTDGGAVPVEDYRLAAVGQGDGGGEADRGLRRKGGAGSRCRLGRRRLDGGVGAALLLGVVGRGASIGVGAGDDGDGVVDWTDELDGLHLDTRHRRLGGGQRDAGGHGDRQRAGDEAP